MLDIRRQAVIDYLKDVKLSKIQKIGHATDIPYKYLAEMMWKFPEDFIRMKNLIWCLKGTEEELGLQKPKICHRNPPKPTAEELYPDGNLPWWWHVEDYEGAHNETVS
jgi:hypothetical protein